MNSYNVKVAKKPFQTLWYIFSKRKDPVTKEQRLFRMMTVITSISDRTNDSWYTFKSVKKRSSFTKKGNSALTEHACLTNHTNGWDKLKVSPLIGVTTNAFFGSLAYHLRPLDDDSLLPEAYLHLVRKKGS